MWICRLPNLQTTELLGMTLGRALVKNSQATVLAVTCVLLRGDLGSGKTTLTRSLVRSLPGGNVAEISSPSFTLCNVYPTTPPVLHCDLYRSETSLPDEIWDALDSNSTLTIIEWGEFVPQAALPKDYLDIRLETCEAERLAVVEPHGEAARAVVLALQHQIG